ncbi:MAG: molybdopterin cofactor-binding domain-containing protein [Beijerinckiaceae bacterium]
MLPQAFSHLFDPPQASRRGFLIGAAAAGSSLVVGFAAAGEPPAGTNFFTGHVKIAPDSRVTIYSAHMDMGQGIYHAIATLVQDELDADWSLVDVVGGYGNKNLFANLAWGGFVQGTGGSSGTFSSWERYRKAGAVARIMLITAAARQWRVAAAEVKAAQGQLSHTSGKSATYGEMAAAAAREAIPEMVVLKQPKDWTYIGSDRLHRYDSAAKSTGRQEFTSDLRLPGLLTAVMIHPPLFGAKLESFDAAKAKAVAGVVDVVAVPRGIAVLATGMWEALKGRDQVQVEWDNSQAETRSSAEIFDSYRAAADKNGEAVAVNVGNVGAAFARASRIVEASYEFPYLAHAALEPLNAVASMNDDGTLEVWGGHQMPDVYRGAAAHVAEITPDKVVLHVMKTGGSFGRRAVMDADIIVEVVSIAKAIGWKAPVKVQWTREDDMHGGRYRPAFVHKLKAGLDADGKIVAFHDRLVGQSIARGTPLASGMIRNGVDPSSVEGIANQPYAIANVRIELTSPESLVPVLWWRAVGSTHTAYVLETFIDELAEAAGKDPVDFRLAMLKDKPRHAAVLKLAAEKAGWGTPLAEGRQRGIAVAESFHTYVAQVAEVSVDPKQGIKVHRVVCAVDCGIAVNPDQVRAQMEGGIGFGLGAILKSQITLNKGKVVEGNFDGYDVLRLNEMPQVEVHIVASNAHPTGVGEPGVPPIGPAVANAVYQATKKRIRVLPFSRTENA